MGCWLVTVKDHESQLQFTVDVDTLQGLAEAVEVILCSGIVPWRQFKSYKLQNKIKPPKKQE